MSDSGHDLEDLVDDLLSQEGAFSGLALQPSYSATLDYLGIPNAIRMNASAFGTKVVLTIPSTGFAKTFTGTSPDDMEDQVEDFFEGEGAEELAKFSKRPLPARRSRCSTAIRARRPRCSRAARSTASGSARCARARATAGSAGRVGALRSRGRGGRRRDRRRRIRLALRRPTARSRSVATSSRASGVVPLAARPVPQLRRRRHLRRRARAGASDRGARPGEGQPVRWVLTPVVQAGGRRLARPARRVGSWWAAAA